MKDDLFKRLPGLDALSPEEAAAIASELDISGYKKGTVLLREGEVCTTCYFILKGCVRQYRLIDGDEKTTNFYTEQQAVVALISYSRQLPSPDAYVCTEDCILLKGEPGQEQEMYARFPKLLEITRAFMEQDFGKAQEAFSRFIVSSPEERYLHLLKTRPELFQRVPLHQIASYLGMTPESLSRIRKRTASKD